MLFHRIDAAANYQFHINFDSSQIACSRTFFNLQNIRKNNFLVEYLPKNSTNFRGAAWKQSMEGVAGSGGGG